MKSKKILVMFIITFALILLGMTKSEATLELNELKFDVQINSDGSMDVIETWDIYISETNTLFKTFEKDSSRYSDITDVKVKEITSENEVFFSQIYEEMYHVTKNCYYALDNSNGKFEIAWGVGLDNSSENKKYQISYTIEDAIAKYNDYSELYWQFIGEDFEIDADKIIGTILLPDNANSKEEIRVWGHTQQLNGEIYVTDLNKIEFKINNYSYGNYVEVRTLIPNDMIYSTNRIYDYEILNSVIEEETEWAEKANDRRKMQKNIIYVALGIGAIVTLFFIGKIFKYAKKIRSLTPAYKPTTKLKYFRELPYEDATPAEAIFMMSEAINIDFSTSFSANILDLCLKKCISIETLEKDGKINSNLIKIKILENNMIQLKKDQKLTLQLLKDVAGENKELTTKDITKYLQKNTSKITELNKKLKDIIEKEELRKENYIKENKKEYDKYSIICAIYFIMFFCTIPLIPLSIVLLINGILNVVIIGKIKVFTQKGVDEKEKWNAFKKYMKEFSLLKEKEIPALVVWEKYLVFATVFGISEKVLKQLKIIYPEITNMDNAVYNYSYIHIMNSVNIGNCINTSVYSAVGSSGSGAGGGFSGGGGGGRWPEVAVADAKILKITIENYVRI